MFSGLDRNQRILNQMVLSHIVTRVAVKQASSEAFQDYIGVSCQFYCILWCLIGCSTDNWLCNEFLQFDDNTVILSCAILYVIRVDWLPQNPTKTKASAPSIRFHFNYVYFTELSVNFYIKRTEKKKIIYIYTFASLFIIFRHSLPEHLTLASS